METLKINRELVTIWALGAASIITVLVTHNRMFMLPLFVYLMYKGVRGVITHRSSLFILPFGFLFSISFFAIYHIVLHSLA